MITAIIFDMDDTLYDEIDYCRSGFRAVARFLAAEEPAVTEDKYFRAFWHEFTNSNRKHTFNAAIDKLGIESDADFISSLVRVYREHRPTIALPVDSREVLEHLKGRFTLALITDGFLPAQQLKVQALQVEGYFPRILYTEDLGREFWKPSTVPFENMLKEIDVLPRQAVYVADNEKKDFIAPNKLGLMTVQMIRPHRLHTQSSPDPDGPADRKITDIRQLPALLEELDK